jgi:MerR family transcriptional regulator/heat shock protein HspR
MALKDSVEKSESEREAFELDAGSAHTIEVAARLAQVPRRLIILYYRHGLVAPVTDPSKGEWYFDDEAIRVMRRIDYLRSTCRLNLAGIKLVLSLTAEVERLRDELRFHHRS